MAVILKLLCIIFLVAVLICIWKTFEYFNTLSESNQWRTLLAWNIVILFFVFIALVIVLLVI